jgi:pimeloyl-ACP methyl ester carboxylesterase
MPNGMNALAEFLAGKADKPAILLLHGFLQTHQFPIIFRLTESLHGEGYTVLAPSLTLGIPGRRQSLACEAIHTHTLDDDAAEIRTWLNWLGSKGYGSVILVGHSTGSMDLLHFLAGHGHPAVRKLIGVSLVEARLEMGDEARRALESDLRNRIARGDKGLVEHQLSFCKRYRGSPASLLSYLEESPERILKTVAGLSLPQAYVMGDHDERMGRNWISRLRQTQHHVHVIKGANHFMDGEYEFDLLDEVLGELRRQDTPDKP